MISSRFFTPSCQLTLFLLLLISPPRILLCSASPEPAGIEAILDPLDPLGDLVQVAPSLALHQQEAEKSQSLPVKAIKTPSGTVKCSCQTVSEEDEGDDPDSLQDRITSPTKTIEIEIYKPAEDEEDEDADSGEGESDRTKPLTFVRNSFTLDDSHGSIIADAEGDAASASLSPFSQDRVFSTEEPNSFLAFLSSLVSSSAQAQALSQSQQSVQAATEPEKIEAKLESEPVHDDDSGDDDLASLSDDVNVANHRIFDTVTATTTLPSVESTVKTVYKAFRTVDLKGPNPVLPSSSSIGNGDSSSEKMDSGNLRDDFFLWDFIYASHAPEAGKKRELLQLGTVTEPFKGPRRRRRRRSVRGSGKNSPVVFVYPVGHQPPPSSASYSDKKQDRDNKILIPPKNKTKPEVTYQKIQKRQGVELGKEEIRLAMQAALDRAWQQYGPTGLPVTPATPSPVYVIPESEVPPELREGAPPPPQQKNYQPQPPPLVRPLPKQSPQQKQQLVYYTPPRPFLYIDRIFNPFQPMTSEWDKHVTTYQEGPPLPPPEPGPFSRFLASYIDFEVNNHEAADLMRKVIFGIFVGFLIAGWIALGAALGIVPFKKLLAIVAGTQYDSSAAKRMDKGKEFMIRDAAISEITDKILLSLDADWLKRLEDRVLASDAASDGGSIKTPTQVFCCVLPDKDPNSNGMAECQVTKSPGGALSHNNHKKKLSAFKCKTDLIYNFHFGPRDDDETEVEQDNTVNVKSKANNDGSSADLPVENEQE